MSKEYLDSIIRAQEETLRTFGLSRNLTMVASFSDIGDPVQPRAGLAHLLGGGPKIGIQALIIKRYSTLASEVRRLADLLFTLKGKGIIVYTQFDDDFTELACVIGHHHRYAY